MNIEHSLIVNGLANADCESLCALLALYEEAYLQNMLFDKMKDTGRWIYRNVAKTPDSSWSECQESFEARLREKSQELLNQSCSDSELRLRMWMQLREGFGLKPELTFSQRGIQDITADISEKTKDEFSKILDDEAVDKVGFFTEEYWTKYAMHRLNPFSNHRFSNPSFADVVQMNVLRLVASAAERGDIPDDLQDELVAKIKAVVSKLDADAQKKLLNQIGMEELSDSAALKLLISSGGLIGFGVAVELAGFSAYILAAKASAILPLVGGKTLVCTVAVLANPFFIIPVLLGGGVFIAGRFRDRLLSTFGITAASILVIRAIAQKTTDPEPMLSVFRNMESIMPAETLIKAREELQKGARNPDFFSTENLLNLSGKLLNTLSKPFVMDSFPNASGYLKRYLELKG